MLVVTSATVVSMLSANLYMALFMRIPEATAASLKVCGTSSIALSISGASPNSSANRPALPVATSAARDLLLLSELEAVLANFSPVCVFLSFSCSCAISSLSINSLLFSKTLDSLFIKLVNRVLVFFVS